MSYFLLSSAHEYLVQRVPSTQVLEVTSAKTVPHREVVIITYDTEDEVNKSIEAPAQTFYYEYYLQRRYSIDFTYTIKNKQFTTRVLLSKAYLESLELKLPIISNYMQCLQIDKSNPKTQDYYNLNRFFHTFKCKSLIEQKLLLNCKLDTSIYDDFCGLHPVTNV